MASEQARWSDAPADVSAALNKLSIGLKTRVSCVFLKLPLGVSSHVLSHLNSIQNVNSFEVIRGPPGP
jgi:hypothetical protein